MQLRNSSTRYGWVSIVIHWGVALVVFGLFALGLWMVGLDYYSAWRKDAPDLHKSIVGNDIEPMALFVSAYRVISFLSRIVGRKNTDRLNLYCTDFTSPNKLQKLKQNLPELCKLLHL